MNRHAIATLRAGEEIFTGPSSLLRVRSAKGAADNTAKRKRNQITYRMPEKASHPKPRNHTHSITESLRDENTTSGAKSSVQAKKIFICHPALTGGRHSTLYA